MSEAVRRLNYDGVFIYRRGQQVDAMRLIHKADGTGEYERLVSLTGSAREIIRNNESVTCIFPDNEEVMVDKSRPEKLVAGLLPEPIEKISRFYSFSISGRDRVAGRESWVVGILPKDMLRYGYVLWIDKDSNLLLKSELKNKSGYVLEQIMFTQLAVLETVSDDMLKPAVSGIDYTWRHSETVAVPGAGVAGWKVTWMPQGFTLSHHEKQTIAASEAIVEHLTFTDGLAMVSVFIEKIIGNPAESSGPSSMGGVNAFARFSKGHQVTAVGEVPLITVQRMADSVVASQ